MSGRCPGLIALASPWRTPITPGVHDKPKSVSGFGFSSVLGFRVL